MFANWDWASFICGIPVGSVVIFAVGYGLLRWLITTSEITDEPDF